MSIESAVFRADEQAVFQLRSLFGSYGYQPYRMSRFEEYELYVRNKDFLVTDRMITFTDTDGTLFALKPDVTISIIKSTKDAKGLIRKVYYNENVYRAEKGENSFRELMQTGLECLGDVDTYNICEVVLIAVKSLELISGENVLDISHLGFTAGLMEAAGVPRESYLQVLRLVQRKSLSELTALCDELDIRQESRRLLLSLVTTSGSIDAVLPKLRSLCSNEAMRGALAELEAIGDLLCTNGLSGKVRIDFSLVNDMNYYNGIVFQGFVKGISTGILSGGQYDSLMQRMGKTSRAIGFAVYLDELGNLGGDDAGADVDILLLYDESADRKQLSRTVEALVATGRSVMSQRAVPQGVRYSQLLRFGEGGCENE